MIHNKVFLSLFVIALGAGIGAAIVRDALAQPIPDVTFPVAELGNCETVAACKSYCGEEKNQDVCEAFGKQHNIGKTKQLEKFARIQEDGGPDGTCGGAANPRRACEAFCSQAQNMRVCLNYAIDHGLMEGRELDEARKVLSAIERGIQLPKGCTNEETCRKTCENPTNVEIARDCFRFAKEANLLPPGVKPDEAERMFELIASGNGPSFEELRKCEALGSGGAVDEATLTKCIDFGVQAGIIKPEEAGLIRKTGGIGPGGCRGKGECETYCNKPENQEACFMFAEKHGLISSEERAMMREGISKFKEIYSKAPPPVAECLKQTVGAEVLDQIAAGAKLPPRDLGDKMRACFEKFFSSQGGPGAEGFPGGFPGAPGEFPGGQGGFPGGPGGAGFPPEVEACLKANGVSLDLNAPPSAELEQKIRECFKHAIGPTQGPCATEAECIAYCAKNPGDPFCAGHGESGTPPPSQTFPQPAPEQFQQQYQKQYEQQFQQQYQQQYQQQFPSGIYPENLTPEQLKQYQQLQQLSPTGVFPGPSPAPPTSIIDPAQACAEKGGSWVNGACAFPAPQPAPPVNQDPSAVCAGKGGSWTGTVCVFPAPTTISPPPPLYQSSPADECAKKGGAWDGKTCVFSAPQTRFNPPSFLEFLAQLLFRFR